MNGGINKCDLGLSIHHIERIIDHCRVMHEKNLLIQSSVNIVMIPRIKFLESIQTLINGLESIQTFINGHHVD